MGKELAVVIPRFIDGRIQRIRATVKDQKWSCPNAKLLDVLGCIQLNSGHHADRDLELAMIAVRKLGGKVVDNRLPNNAKHGLPK